MEVLVDTRVAAEILGMSYDWLRKQVKAGLVECHRFGRVVRFSGEQIERIKADHLQPVAPAVPALSLVRAADKPKPRPKPKPMPSPTKPRKPPKYTSEAVSV